MDRENKIWFLIFVFCFSIACINYVHSGENKGPDLYQRVKRLEQKVKFLENQLNPNNSSVKHDGFKFRGEYKPLQFDEESF